MDETDLLLKVKNELKLEKQIIVGIFLKQYDHKKNNVALLLGKHVLVNTLLNHRIYL